MGVASFGPVFDLWHHPKNPAGSLFKGIRQKEYKDHGDGQLAIEIIGSDAAGKLFTGNVHRLDLGLVAVETAWLGGKGNSSEKKEAWNNCCHDHCALDKQSWFVQSSFASASTRKCSLIDSRCTKQIQ